MLETADPAAVVAAAGDAMAHTTESDTGPKPASERRRPRKKLSFREPEIVGCEKYRQMKERSGESIIKPGRCEAEGAAEPAAQRDGGQERQANGEQDRRQDCQQDRRQDCQQDRRQDCQQDRRQDFQQDRRQDRRQDFQQDRRQDFQQDRRQDFQQDRRQDCQQDRRQDCQQDRRQDCQQDRRQDCQQDRRQDFQQDRRQDCQQDRRQDCQQDRRQDCQQNGQLEGRDNRASLLLPERQRGGSLDSQLSSLDSQLSVRLVLRPGAAGVTSIETETPPAPARYLIDSPRLLGSMDDLDLQDEALEIVRSVGLAFELSQCLEPGMEQSETAADVVEEPEPAVSPDRLSADSPSSASGDDTPQQKDVVSNATPEQSAPRPSSLPVESVPSEVTPPLASRRLVAGDSPARERLSRRQRLSRSPDKRHLSPAATTRRPHSLPRPPRGGVRGVQPLSRLVAGQGALLDHLSKPWPDYGAESASLHHQMQLVCSQLTQQRQQTQAAQAQVSLVRHQLQAETAARLQAHHRSHQLLEHNRQLLEHVQQLVGELQQLQIQADHSETVSPDTSFASLSSEEAVRTEPDAGLQLLWDLERLNGSPLSPLGQYSSPASQWSTLERLGGGAPLGQYSPSEMAMFGAEPLFDLGQFSSAPPSPLSRTDPLMSELGAVSFAPLSPLAMENGTLPAASPFGGLGPLPGRRRHEPGQGSGTQRRSTGHHRHMAARHAPLQ